MKALDWTWRWVPGHEWVAITIVWDGQMETGVTRMYRSGVRRNAWKVGRFGLAVMRLPRGG